MFKEPEDFIISTIAIVWIVLCYWIAQKLNMGWLDKLHIVIGNIIWVVFLYIAWQLDFMRFLNFLFVGLFTVCWWPILHQFTASDAPVPIYATFKAKIIYSILASLIAFIYFFVKNKKRSHI